MTVLALFRSVRFFTIGCILCFWVSFCGQRMSEMPAVVWLPEEDIALYTPDKAIFLKCGCKANTVVL